MYGIDMKDPENSMDKDQKKIMLDVIDFLKGKNLSVLDAAFILRSAATKVEILAMHRKI